MALASLYDIVATAPASRLRTTDGVVAAGVATRGRGGVKNAAAAGDGDGDDAEVAGGCNAVSSEAAAVVVTPLATVGVRWAKGGVGAGNMLAVTGRLPAMATRGRGGVAGGVDDVNIWLLLPPVVVLLLLMWPPFDVAGER